MELLNTLNDEETKLSRAALDQILPALVLLIGPFAPYLAEELWEQLGRKGPVFRQPWPAFDRHSRKRMPPTWCCKSTARFAGDCRCPSELRKRRSKKLALADPKVQPFIDGKQVVKIIVVPDKLVNIVVK